MCTQTNGVNTMSIEDGLLISVDGLGGSGKTTQIEKLKAYLESIGHAVRVQKFPDYESPTGKIIKSYLDGQLGKPEDIPADYISGLYALDRAAAFKEIEHDLSHGDVIILDRSYFSGAAYQAAHEYTYGDEDPHQYLARWLDIEFNHVGVRPPHVALYLAVTAERALGLIDARGEVTGEGRDIHEGDHEFMDIVIDNFDHMTELYDLTKINVMDNNEMRSADDIHADIKSALAEELVRVER
ncbi:thymidylate kinase [Vibrio phage vB_pir03]|nr:thymidylate kinase [Vibrio phage vB_pir03]